jgi:hypothetical protein
VGTLLFCERISHDGMGGGHSRLFVEEGKEHSGLQYYGKCWQISLSDSVLEDGEGGTSSSLRHNSCQILFHDGSYSSTEITTLVPAYIIDEFECQIESATTTNHVHEVVLVTRKGKRKAHSRGLIGAQQAPSELNSTIHQKNDDKPLMKVVVVVEGEKATIRTVELGIEPFPFHSPPVDLVLIHREV